MDQPDLTQFELFETKDNARTDTFENTILVSSQNDPSNPLNVRDAAIMFFALLLSLKFLRIMSSQSVRQTQASMKVWLWPTLKQKLLQIYFF